MNLNDQVTPQREDFFAFMNDYPADTPVAMINILKFKEKSGKGDESGQAAYLRYSKNMEPLLAKAGAKILWGGKVNQTVIGDTSDQPHMVFIVEYPSKQAFIDMSTSEEYKVIGQDREIALEYGGLLASSTINQG
ncbi:MAG: DUF1330 domain-containing protein [Chloroflexota bacterium]